MANDDDGGLPAGGGNCSLEELLQIARANLKDCEAQARPHREAQLSSRGDRDLRKARRHEIPAPPELSESDEEGIRHQRYRDRNSSSDEEVEQWILVEPRFDAQPRYLYHLQPPPPSHSHETYRGTSLGARFDIATNRKLKHLDYVNLHSDPTISNELLSNSQFIGKAKEMLDEVMIGKCAESGKANESLDLFDRSLLDAIVCDSLHFTEPMNDYCAEKNYKTVPKHKPTLHKNQPTTLVDMMRFVSDLFDFEEEARSEESNRTPLLYQDKTTIEDYSTQAYIGLGNSIEHSHNGQDKDMLDKAMPVEEKGHRKITPFFIPYTITNMGSALLAIDLGFIGPNYSISTACAPSNYCFYAAANHIRGGETDMMIAGGTEAAIIPIGFGVFVVYLNKKSIDELAEIKHGSSWTPTVEKIAYWRTAKAKTIQVHTLYDLHISSSSSSSRLNSRYSPGIVFNFTIYLLL
ncbi:hypothetical protein LWI28_007183 [Acer negundo]|uniref:beta-ketoacyl-[acyl-carrier-protein] synthase I n=1 Tax=Acer negundo TaxID=4023 RepID=A0AAD5NGA1_ACENE|nr:hypothetical protein LWI28_007183 [Acer negundo]